MSTQPKQIVVIGGGYVGIQFAQELAKFLPASAASITVIEKNEFTYHCVGVPRALVDPTFVKKLFIPVANALPASHSKVIRGIADAIEGNEVRVRKIGDNNVVDETTSNVPFDYLILATGSSYVSPIKVPSGSYTRENVENAIVDTANHIKAASSVLIIGGGPVGVEIAGEIAVAFPDKTVTILDAHDKLIGNSALTDKFRNNLTARLNALKVKLVLGERLPTREIAHGFEKKTVQTDKGTSIESDVQLVAAGSTPNASLIQKLDPTLLTEHGAVKVTAGLQLDDPRFSTIFAIGDVNNHATPKLAYTGALQAKHLAKQLATVIKAGSGAVAPYVTGAVEGMIVPLGPTGGVGQLPLFGGVVVGNFVVRLAKAKDYFAAQFWGLWHAVLPTA
ncbi:hypothetical protein H257_02038 [Aphanomyces astaci]|uniref:FAD/NAD(P)-binding domain-containing protein n=1 Tax=Aphanomyces astaci TaxID=112090 RepID=W4H542_APHAT|nr:hypothetical protein H257_02038 [Aphanomyces astaci]ETV87027.1 hypothetical protein H257_02038 [Aphanomyces astaci]|eukprot:XP_009823826.1 hypothetical protein H257_02038 [Aphanomyces astaci]